MDEMKGTAICDPPVQSAQFHTLVTRESHLPIARSRPPQVPDLIVPFFTLLQPGYQGFLGRMKSVV